MTVASTVFAGKSGMRVTVGRGERAPAPRRVVPAMPTTWPSMLIPRPAATSPLRYPFDQPGLRFRYFARNAVWDAIKLLDLKGKKVLFPAYHHGVELETLLAAGVEPIFFRVDSQMRGDLEDAKKRMTADTAALYIIHYAGFPQDVDGAVQLCKEKGLPLIEDCALALLSRRGRDPLGSFGDASVFCLYKTIPVPNGGALLINNDQLKNKLVELDEPTAPPLPSTASHLIGGLLSNLELRVGPAGAAMRAALRRGGRWVKRTSKVAHVSTGTQHFNEADVGLGMSAASHVVLRNQDCASIVERRRRNYFFLYAALRDVAPPLTGELPPGTCPLFYPLPLEEKASAMARLLARGIETVDFWRVRHPRVPAGAFPEVDRLRETILELPVHQDLSPADMDHVAACVRELIG